MTSGCASVSPLTGVLAGSAAVAASFAGDTQAQNRDRSMAIKVVDACIHTVVSRDVSFFAEWSHMGGLRWVTPGAEYIVGLGEIPGPKGEALGYCLSTLAGAKPGFPSSAAHALREEIQERIATGTFLGGLQPNEHYSERYIEIVRKQEEAGTVYAVACEESLALTVEARPDSGVTVRLRPDRPDGCDKE